MRYELLKDLPEVKAGTVGEKLANGQFEFGSYDSYNYTFTLTEIEKNPDWFKPIEEKKCEVLPTPNDDYLIINFKEDIKLAKYNHLAIILEAVLNRGKFCNDGRDIDILGQSKSSYGSISINNLTTEELEAFKYMEKK